ncbi:MAG TPA: flagellar basal body rod C-terminal domain-containing protein [Acetobacteraceae bacterium]|nr:flagellar basal body rod C-terminal domain-containing protein [Acetobacteraceae bacterium]
MMTLDTALTSATSGLAAINRQLAVVSQNVSNASTPGYAQEVVSLSSLTAAGDGMGVRVGPTTLQISQQLQSSVLAQNAVVGNLQTTQTALSAIDAVQGTPGAGTDLASLLGDVTNAFSTLSTDPSNTTYQSQVVSSAQTLAQGINTLAQAYGTQRQASQDDLVSDVASLNQALQQIGQLNTQIQQLQANGVDTADLQNQRNAAMATASQYLAINFVPQSDGTVLAVSNGAVIPLTGSTGPFSVASAQLGPNAAYPASAPAVMLNGQDVTTQIGGGSIGADITLRDQTLPTFQAELDEFSETLASRFQAQGLTLFSNASGTVPTASAPPVQQNYVGFANTIQVNPAVTQTPSLVRDGTQSVTIGGVTYNPNPAGGPAGFSDLINRILTYATGSQVASGIAQPAPATSGLGPTGTLTAPFTAPTTLSAFASTLVAAQSQQSSSTQTQLSTEQAVQTTLQTKLADSSSVSIDTEMSTMIQLQNAYGANAKIITTAQSMFTTLLQAVTP